MESVNTATVKGHHEYPLTDQQKALTMQLFKFLLSQRIDALTTKHLLIHPHFTSFVYFTVCWG